MSRVFLLCLFLLARACRLCSARLCSAETVSVYFTPHQAVDQLLLKTLSSARDKIYLASYDFSYQPLMELLLRLKRDRPSLTLRIICENPSEKWPPVFREMVRIDRKSSLFHAKFITIDGQLLITGSLNFTNDSFFLHHNQVFFFHDPELTQIFEKRFEAWWENKPGPASYRRAGLLAGFSPDFDCETAIATALAQARESIHFSQFQFTSQSLAELLVKKSLTGCRVYGLMEATGTGPFSVYPFLFDLGVAVRRNLMAGLLHDKNFIIDGRTVITGSYNPTAAARNNVESLLILKNENLARQLLREWKRLWRWKSLPE
ncbi:MAG TPA: phospholipase D-like domain-containing protein [bacterium]|nr:phospholipase D-like domain-containing protein [bacterium]HPP12615.1 phospholipase D-like domain-containing protein [bacterium]